ncbi:hypothetical protein [Microcoleus sp. herbarium14]|uniref:hypothetical protein n=1 Tax=Microcoleus sp. herbarium14 TaxID=3055439 RepID=UPI002FD735BA
MLRLLADRTRVRCVAFILRMSGLAIAIYINSGCIAINITRNQDTAFGVSLRLIWRARNGILSVLAYHSGAAGIDII